MGFFTRACRNAGLMIHGIVEPIREHKRLEQRDRPREISRTVEEKKLNATTTLRRTTIDEIEVRHEEEDTK